MTTPLTLDEYQKRAKETAVYPSIVADVLRPIRNKLPPGFLDKFEGELTQRGFACNPYYIALGLAGEVGEICEKLKKCLRDHDGDFTDEAVREAVKKELGDALWYWSQLCEEFGFDAGAVAQANLDKLTSRKDRGVLKGEGDNR